MSQPQLGTPINHKVGRQSPSDDSSSNGSDNQTRISQVSQADEKVLVAAPIEAPIAVKPPPDGGFVAWLQVVGSFFLIFNCWGIVNTFGVFQTYYEAELLLNKTPSDISWIGSLEGFLLLTISVLAGPLYDRGHFRALIISGTILLVLGVFLLSICDQYWQIMLTQGVLVGFGAGLLFLPSVAILPTYFVNRKALATGIAMSGSGLGGIIYPIVFHKLQPEIGFGWATRVIGFIMLGTLVIPIVGMKMRAKPPGVRKMIELEAWKDVPYALLGAGVFLGFAGLYIPMFYIQTYALYFNIADANIAFYLLPILNAASIFGRVLPNILTDRIGIYNVFIPACLICSILAFVWIGIKTLGGLIAFAIIYGFFSGTFLSLAPLAVVVLIVPNMSRIGVRMGMNFFLGALGLLIGTPIAGAIVKQSWPGLQAYGAVSLLVCVCLLIGVRGTKKSLKLTEKF